VLVKLAAKAKLRVSLDGGAFQDFSGGPGVLHLTPEPLPSGEHSLLLMEVDHLAFQGFELAPGAKSLPVL